MQKESVRTENEKLHEQLELLQARLAEAEETLRAIRQGEVDALVVDGPVGPQIYTLQGADKPHRLLLEAMNEGAMTLTPEGLVLYCNTRLAEMVKKPLEQIIGSPWQGLVPAREQGAFQEIFTNAKQDKEGRSKGESALRRCDDSLVPVNVSVSSADLDGIPAMAVLLTDISKRQADEQALREANENLESRVRERTEQLEAELAERRRAEQVAQESQEQFRMVAENARTVFGIIQGKRFLWANPYLTELSGYTLEEIVSMDFIHMVHPDFREQIADYASRRQLGEAVPTHYEFAMVTKSGETRWMDFSPGRIEYKGKPAIVGTAFDITARKETEKKLQESEERFRRLFEDDLTGDFISTADGKILLCNSAFASIFGFPSAKAAVGTNMLDLYIDKGHREPLLQRLRQHQKIERTGTWRQRRDGEPIYIIENLVGIFDAEGELQEIKGYIYDDTERTLAEEALRASEERYRSFVEASSQVVWRTNAQGAVDQPIPSWNAYTGQTDEEAAGFGWMNAIRPEDRPHVAEAWKAASAARSLYQVEYCLQRHDGNWRHILARGVPVLEADGQVREYIGTCIDVTDQREAEDALRRAKDALAGINRELEQRVRERTTKLNEMVQELEHFSYTITHDMRAPLRAMHGLSKMLINECSVCEHGERRDWLRRIADASTRMDSLITDALNYNRAVREKLDVEPVDAREQLGSMLETYPEFQSHMADIKVEGEFSMVMGNKAGLTQCFSNFLNNAIKFVEPGKVPQIRIWAETHGEWVRIHFKDNGIGIPPPYQEQIWGMFQRLSKAYEGTGIGLALVRKVVDRMGGKAGLESEPGQGSTFWLDLKRAS